MKPRLGAYTIDVGQVGALDHAPADTGWHGIKVTDLYDQNAVDATKLVEGTYSLLSINATAAVGDVLLALREVAGLVTKTHRIRIPAGSWWSRGIRGVRGSDGEGLSEVSIALETGTDTIYITADVDLPQI